MWKKNKIILKLNQEPTCNNLKKILWISALGGSTRHRIWSVYSIKHQILTQHFYMVWYVYIHRAMPDTMENIKKYEQNYPHNVRGIRSLQAIQFGEKSYLESKSR